MHSAVAEAESCELSPLLLDRLFSFLKLQGKKTVSRYARMSGGFAILCVRPHVLKG
jgi:hypothetical protein